MKKKPRKPMVPRIAQETTRHAIIELLTDGPVSAKDISIAVRLPEKEVSSHLEHIRRSLHATGAVLEVTPPGKCPVCRSEAIDDPLFSIRGVPEHEPD